LRRFHLLLLLIALPGWADDPAPAESATSVEIVERYVSAVETQRNHQPALSMEVDINASLPRLNKQGRLHALRFITRLGQIFYRTTKFEGDNTVKKEVIGRYLQAESQAKAQYAKDIQINPGNYKFKYRGTTDYNGRLAHVFELQPRKKKVGLFKGELWIDSESFLPLREWGEFVKNPSVFLRNVYFVRDYFIRDGVSIPRRIISNVDTRIVGRASLTIWFDKVNVNPEAEQGVTTTASAKGLAGRLP
jgi:hypothetical protein